jgi:hypothetical protein
VTPLHRLANWDFRNGRGPFVLFLLNWAVVGLFSFFGAVFRLTTAWQPVSPWVVFAIILFPVALIQSGVRLWNWEERRQVAETATQDRIAELERELGIGS